MKKISERKRESVRESEDAIVFDKTRKLPKRKYFGLSHKRERDFFEV